MIKRIIVSLIVLIIGAITMYYARKKHSGIITSLSQLNEDEKIKYKKDRMYEYWSSRIKHIILSLTMVFAGMIGFFYFLTNTGFFEPMTFTQRYGKELSYASLFLLFIGLFYVIFKVSYPRSLYKAYLEDFENEGVYESELISEFKNRKAPTSR